jgi:hypothetical protein
MQVKQSSGVYDILKHERKTGLDYSTGVSTGGLPDDRIFSDALLACNAPVTEYTTK